MMVEEKEIDNEVVSKGSDEPIKLKGKYISVTGRRKTSVARVRLYKNGNGSIQINDKKASEYFTPDKVAEMKLPLKQSGHVKDLNFSIVVSGGGLQGQAIAAKHGISKALVEYDVDTRPALKAKGWLTRDSRQKERKKPGLKRARKAPQWAKR